MTVVLKFMVHNLCLCFKFSQHVQSDSIFILPKYAILNVVYSGYFLHLLLLQHEDTESNSGPKKEQIKYLPCCHWNVNSFLAQNMSQISQIEECNSIYSYEFICIAETYFDSSILGDTNFN